MIFPFALSSQDCFITLPQDTFICGFSQEFLIQPEGGVWSFNCGANQTGIEQAVTITNLGNGFCSFTFNTCGIFEMVYAYEEPGVCLEIDTFLVYVDDPSNSSQSLDFENTLEYESYGCHSGGSAECENTLSLGGQSPPTPIWDICGEGNCQSTLYTPIVTPNPNDPCLPLDIQIQAVTAGSTFSSCWSGEQDSFVILDTETGEVLENDFLAYLDSLGLADIFSNLTDCSFVDFSCFTVDEECIDSIVYDTSELLFPIHLGGNWNLLLAQDTIRMTDTTAFEYLSVDYILIIEPGADYYGPDNIDLSIFEITANDTIIPSDYLSFQMQWTEDWIYDTIELVSPEIYYSDSLGCQTCGGNAVFSAYNIPDIPAFDCPPISISFDFTCACFELDIWASATNINCVECGSLSASSSDPSVVFDWQGPGVNGMQGSDIQGICVPGTYTVVATNAWGCSNTTSVSIVVEINNVNAYIDPPASLTSAQPCTVLNGFADSDFPTNLQISWSGPNNFSAFDLNPTVCEPGVYTLYVWDSQSLCEDQFSVTVEEMIVLVETISAEICDGDCYTIEDQEYCETGFYVYQASPTLIYELNLLVHSKPDVEILTPTMITAEQSCVDIVVMSTGQDLSNFSYSWIGPAGFASLDMNIEVCQEGEYNLIVTDLLGHCVSNYSVLVKRLDVREENICAGDCFEFNNMTYCEEGVVLIETGPYNLMELTIFITALEEDFKEARICPGESFFYRGVEYSEAGNHAIVLASSTSCDTILHLEILEYRSLPDVEDVYEEYCVVDNMLIGPNLIDTEGLSFSWSDGSNAMQRTISRAGIYDLEISTACESREHRYQIVATVDKEEDELYIPNILSPNRDGLNEEFRVQSGVELSDLTISVFDRWGNPLFFTRSISDGWDGTFNNNQVPSNSYVYVVEYSVRYCDSSLHKKIKTGTVTLLR